jgi:hypothetical protein
MGNILSLAQGKFMEQLGNSGGNSNLRQLCMARRFAFVVCILLTYKCLSSLSSVGCAAVPIWLGTQSAVRCLSLSDGEST